MNLSGTVGAARAGAAAGIPALATSAGTPTTTSFTAAVATTIAWLKANRAHLHRGTRAEPQHPRMLGRLGARTLSVTSAPTLAAGVNPFVTVDCTQTTAAATDDVGAFLQGYATLAKIPAAATS